MRTLRNRFRLEYLIPQFVASVVEPCALAAIVGGVAIRCLGWSVPIAWSLALVVTFVAFALSIEAETLAPIDLKEHTGRLMLVFLIPVACVAASVQLLRSFSSVSDHVISLMSGVLGLISFLVLTVRLFPGSTKSKDFRGRNLITFREASRKARRALARNDTGLLWGGLRIPSHMATKHFAVVSLSGGGKTLTLRLLMQSALPAIREGSDQRALIYDAKQDVLGLLHGMGIAAPITILNPFDERCAAWDIAADITGPAICQEVATILIPEERSSQPFFTDAARHLLYGVMLSFILTAKGAWTFSDVVLAMRSKERIEQILARTPETSELVELYFGVPERIADIIATISTKLAPFEVIAACWQRAETKISLRDWLSSASILVMGTNEAAHSALQAINRVLFKRISELMLDQSESESRRTWIFLDEARQAGHLDGLGSLMTNGRSKGAAICLGFQDIEGLRDVYGDKAANEIVGQCSNIAVLRLASPATAKWASDLFGPFEKVEHRTSESSNTSTSGKSSGSTKSEHLAQRPAVLESEFFELPPTNPKNGLSGFYLQPEIGAYPATLSGKWITERLRDPDPEVPNLMPRPEEQQYLQPWNEDDLKRLGLDTLDVPAAQPPHPRRTAERERKRPGGLNSLQGFGDKR